MPNFTKFFYKDDISFTNHDDVNVYTYQDSRCYYYFYTDNNDLKGNFNTSSMYVYSYYPYGSSYYYLNENTENNYIHTEVYKYFYDSLIETLQELDENILFLQDYNEEHGTFKILDVPFKVVLRTPYRENYSYFNNEAYRKRMPPWSPFIIPCLPTIQSTSRYTPYFALTCNVKTNSTYEDVSYNYNFQNGDSYVTTNGPYNTDYACINHGISEIFKPEILKYGFEINYNNNFIHIMLLSSDNKRMPFMFIAKGKTFNNEKCWYLSGDPSTYSVPYDSFRYGNRCNSTYTNPCTIIYRKKNGLHQNFNKNSNFILTEKSFELKDETRIDSSDFSKINFLPYSYPLYLPSYISYYAYNAIPFAKKIYYNMYSNKYNSIKIFNKGFAPGNSSNNSSYTYYSSTNSSDSTTTTYAYDKAIRGSANNYQIYQPEGFKLYYKDSYEPSSYGDSHNYLNYGSMYGGIFTKLDILLDDQTKSVLGLENNNLLLVPPIFYYGLLTFDNLFIVPNETEMNCFYKVGNDTYATPQSDFSIDDYYFLQKFAYKI